MSNDELADLTLTLKLFRSTVITALADLSIEVNALHKTLLESKTLTEEQLQKIRADTRRRVSDDVRQHYQNLIEKIG